MERSLAQEARALLASARALVTELAEEGVQEIPAVPEPPGNATPRVPVEPLPTAARPAEPAPALHAIDDDEQEAEKRSNGLRETLSELDRLIDQEPPPKARPIEVAGDTHERGVQVHARRCQLALLDVEFGHVHVPHRHQARRIPGSVERDPRRADHVASEPMRRLDNGLSLCGQTE